MNWGPLKILSFLQSLRAAECLQTCVPPQVCLPASSCRHTWWWSAHGSVCGQHTCTLKGIHTQPWSNKHIFIFEQQMCERQRDISFISKCANLIFPAANKQQAIRKPYLFLSYLRSYLHKIKYELGGKCSSTKHCNAAAHFFMPLPTNPERSGWPALNINMKRLTN